MSRTAQYVPGQFDDISDEEENVPNNNTDQILSQIMLEKLSGKYQTANSENKGEETSFCTRDNVYSYVNLVKCFI